jgi:hypothetical protein
MGLQGTIDVAQTIALKRAAAKPPTANHRDDGAREKRHGIWSARAPVRELAARIKPAPISLPDRLPALARLSHGRADGARASR